MSLRKQNKNSCHLNDIIIDSCYEKSYYDPKNENIFGRIFMNETFNLSLAETFACLFDYKNIHEEYKKRRKIIKFKTENWNEDDGFKKRTNELEVEVCVMGTSKISYSTEIIKVLNYVDDEYSIVEAEVHSTGILYSDCFKIFFTHWITQIKPNVTNLLIRGSIRYINKPNFFIKNLIEKVTFDGLKENYEVITELLKQEEAKSRHIIEDSSEFSNEDEKELELEQHNVLNNSLENDFKSSQIKLCKITSLNSFVKFDKVSLKSRLGNSMENGLAGSSVNDSYKPLKFVSSRNKYATDSNSKQVNINMNTKKFARFFFIL